MHVHANVSSGKELKSLEILYPTCRRATVIQAYSGQTVIINYTRQLHWTKCLNYERLC